ncbi:hypothetical protein [Ferroacidibacillus organovorans]|uniref:Uncharacterized protein n=1 Tax=Ferroacidibacillus organovorans TaxID=1765683 RepID=A0A124IVW5_9BACL|nr:hypothetical protein [Ferroacidibacillus organovorans]KUO95536.1 hypothetical protein ATW55_06510 [Ferroacidibacillus organovorans]
MIPSIQFQGAEHCAFYFEDVHLMLVQFERESFRMLYLLTGQTGDALTLSFPGSLYTEQVMEQVERIFFVELNELQREPVRLALGAYFPVGSNRVGAYYERGSDETTLYFLRIVGDAPDVTLETIEDPSEHRAVAEAFQTRYQNVFFIEK